MVNFHRILISTAIAFSAGFAIWSAIAYSRNGGFWTLASAVGFGLAALAFALYLKNLRRFLGGPGE